MTDVNQKSELGQFLAEMRRRRVVRFALAYAAAAFVALQLAEIVFPAFGIGEGGLRILVVVTTLGFPPSLVLAWVYDLTRHGLRRTEEAPTGPVLQRLALVGLVMVTFGATGALGLYLARQGVFLPTPQEASAPTSAPAARSAAYDPSEPIRSIAVLPLDDFSPGGDQAYFTASMHEELIAKLSMIDGVRVVSRTSSMRFAGTDLTMPQIGRELGVDVVVEGSVSRTPERTRVTLQLIHAPSDSHITTLQWDREEVTDVLAFQTEIAREVVDEVGAQDGGGLLTEASNEVAPAAQDAYFRGRYEYQKGTPEGLRLAYDYFQEASREDPDFAPALAGMAGTRFLMGLDEAQVSADELTEAREVALAALEADSTSMEALDVLTLIERSLPRVTAGDARIPAPPRTIRQTHVIAMPDGADSIVIDMHVIDTSWVAAMTPLGERIEERVSLMAQAGDRSGTARPIARAGAHLVSGRYAEAASLLEQVVEEAPQASRAWEMLIRAYVSTGALDQAGRAAEKWRDSGAPGAPGHTAVAALRGALAAAGVGGYWAWQRQRLDSSSERGEQVTRMDYATAHAALGDRERALRYLVEAIEAGEPGVPGIRSDPAWDSLRRDPTFLELARQVETLHFTRSRPGGSPPPR